MPGVVPDYIRIDDDRWALAKMMTSRCGGESQGGRREADQRP
jgi:hypothetical protein